MRDDFVVGENLTFHVYGTTVKGDFVKKVGGSVTIKTTHDFVCDVGEEQDINEQFLVGN